MTDITVDVAMIVAILVSAALQLKFRKKDREKIEEVHTLVNDQMTLEKIKRLKDLKAQKLLITRMLGDDMEEEDREMIRGMKGDIRDLTEEVRSRDQTADRISARRKL